MRDPKELGQVCTLNSFGPIARGRNHAVRVCHRAELCYAHQVLVDHGQGSNCKDFTIDQALDHVGGFGAFQRWNTFLLGTVWLLCGMFALGPVSWNIKMMHDMGCGGCREEQLANTVYFGAQFIANAAWGPAADRLGRRSVLLAALGFDTSEKLTTTNVRGSQRSFDLIASLTATVVADTCIQLHIGSSECDKMKTKQRRFTKTKPHSSHLPVRYTISKCGS